MNLKFRACITEAKYVDGRIENISDKLAFSWHQVIRVETENETGYKFWTVIKNKKRYIFNENEIELI